MTRRLIACLMAFLLLFAAPARAAELGNVADLAILSQLDDRFQVDYYRYNNNFFRYGGCGPASVTNGLIAALDVTDPELAAGMLKDVLTLLTRMPHSKYGMQIAKLDYLNFSVPQIIRGDDMYPSLTQALQDFGGAIRFLEGYVTVPALEEALASVQGQRTVLHGTLGSSDRWALLNSLITTLMEAGYEDARIVVAYLGAGTIETKSPFRSGTAGHYLDICLPLEYFCETGEVYVLDSLPRALEGEPFGFDEFYAVQYDFLRRQTYENSLIEFNALFRVERVQPTIVKTVPIGEAAEAREAAVSAGTRPLDALLPYLDKVINFHGTSHIFITLPER